MLYGTIIFEPCNLYFSHFWLIVLMSYLNSYSIHEICTLYFLLNFLLVSCLGFGDFQKKKRLNTRGFAWEFLRSGMLYIPDKSLKRRGKSSSLHLKKNFLLEDAGFFVSDVASGGLLGHLGPLCVALDANH